MFRPRLRKSRPDRPPSLTDAPGETLRSESFNGNINCAGSHGYSRQTINGRTTCISGKGGIVQSFGGGQLQTASLSADDMPTARDLRTNAAIERWIRRVTAKCRGE